MPAYRETFELASPMAGEPDSHGQTTFTYPVLARAAARRITINETANSVPAADLSANSLTFEVRTNQPIAVGWRVKWRGSLYRVTASDTTEHLKAIVTLAPW